MSWELLHTPGARFDRRGAARIWRTYRASHFIVGKAPESEAPEAETGRAAADASDAGGDRAAPTWQNLYRLMLSHMLAGEFDAVQRNYVFDTRPLTDNRPYFAAYIKALEIPHFLDQPRGGVRRMGLSAALGDARHRDDLRRLPDDDPGGGRLADRLLAPARQDRHLRLLLLPGSRLHHDRGRPDRQVPGRPVEPDDLGDGADYQHAVLLPALGSLVSARFVADCRRVMPRIFLGIAALVALGALLFDPVLGAIGQWPYPLRIATCILLIAPAAFLMGFPFPTGMTMLYAPGQGAVLPVGVGHQRHLLGGRRGRGADRQRAVRPADPAARLRRALPARPAGLLQPAQTGTRHTRPQACRGGFETLPYECPRSSRSSGEAMKPTGTQQ